MTFHPNRNLFFFFFIAAFIATLPFASPLLAASTPRLPARIIRISGNAQTTGIVATRLQRPLTVLVTDNTGAPLSRVQIDWKVIAGGGSVPLSASTTNSTGLARSTFTLGTVYTNNTATATIHGTGKSVSFWAIAYPGPAVTITRDSGDQQAGIVGAALPLPLRVICRDQYGNIARHTQVDWSVISGAGFFSSPATTSISGLAANKLTLGVTMGTTLARATIHGAGLSTTFAVTASAASAAQLTLDGGNNQVGARNTPLARPFTVVVKDRYGNLKAGAAIDWRVLEKDGSFAPASTVTTTRGRAGSTLVLGEAIGSYHATATIHGTGISVPINATGAHLAVIMEPDPDAAPQAFQPYFLGLSYPKIKINHPFFDKKNLALVALFHKLGPGVLRILGEQPQNPVAWVHDGPGMTYNQLSRADLLRLGEFVKAVHWKVLYGVALAGNRATCAAGQTDCAADEAAVAVEAFGGNLMGFEIGNEPDIYWQPVYGAPPAPQLPRYTFAEFLSTPPLYRNGTLLPTWPAFANALQRAAPAVSLTGPATGINWFRLFAFSNQADRVSMLTRHYYRLSLADRPTVAKLLTPDPRIPIEFAEMRQAAASANVPGGYRVAECNSVAAYIHGVTDAFGSALWTLDFLFTNALYHSSGVNFHSGGDQPGTFSPILDDHFSVVGIGPDYYGLLAYSLVAKGGALMTTHVTPSTGNFSAYAIQQPNGSTDVILSNKDPQASLTVSVHRKSSTSQATSLLMTAPKMTATKGFELGGSPVNLDGSWSPTSTQSWHITGNSAIITVPPGSAQIVHLR